MFSETTKSELVRVQSQDVVDLLRFWVIRTKELLDWREDGCLYVFH